MSRLSRAGAFSPRLAKSSYRPVSTFSAFSGVVIHSIVHHDADERNDDLEALSKTIAKSSTVYIECKVKPNKPTPKQLEFIAKAREAGCLAGVCYSPEDALRLVIPKVDVVDDDF